MARASTRAALYVDGSEVRELAVNLQYAPTRVTRAAGKIFADEADALHRNMRQDAQGHRHLGSFARHMAKEKVSDLHYVVGFNKRGQGNLANIIAFGSVNNAPVYDFYGPIRRRTDPFIEYLADACEDALFRGSE